MQYTHSIAERILVTDPTSIKCKLEKAKDRPFVATQVHNNYSTHSAAKGLRE